MLTIKCAKCKSKLFKYRKIGSGKVLKCYKKRIKKFYNLEKCSNNFECSCGNLIGIDEGNYIKMNSHNFIYTGKKE